MNSKKRSFSSIFVFLVLIGLLILKIVPQEIDVIHIKYLEIVYLIILIIALIWLHDIYKNKYKNLRLFLFLTFLLFGFLPYCHYISYSLRSDNYNFTEEYLKNNVKMYKSNLKNYKDSIVIKELFFLLKQNKINETHYDTIQSVGDFSLVFKSYKSGAVVPTKGWFISLSIGGGVKTPNYNYVLISKKGEKKVIKLKMKFEKLKLVLANYLKEKNEILKMIDQPEKYIPFSDFWVDSVTGFAFSFIKPVSKLSQMIRLTQIVSVFFFLHMLSSLLKLLNEFEITEIKNKPHP